MVGGLKDRLDNGYVFELAVAIEEVWGVTSAAEYLSTTHFDPFNATVHA